ncbi:phage tail protein, partial [Acinetobacter baumannii]|nr:phage tail protein [Acinetobacter baumannii]
FKSYCHTAGNLNRIKIGMGFSGRLRLITEIKSFLDDHKGADSFYWQSPKDGRIRVKAGDYQLVDRGSGTWRISTTFTQVFYP